MRFNALAAVLVGATLLASGASATVYNYTGPLFTNVSAFTNCQAGGCFNYVLGTDRNSGSLTTAAPLTPNMDNVDIAASGQLTAYSLTDNHNTLTNANSYARFARVTTNGNGDIVSYNMSFQRLQSGYVKEIDLANVTLNDHAQNNLACYSSSGNPPQCFGTSFVPSSSSGDGPTQAPSGFTAVASVAPAPVPTLSQWALILLGVSLGGIALLSTRRRIGGRG